MKKNINFYIFTYLTILFLFSVFFLYLKHGVSNDSTISEWLINYEGGFTKRGLIGQLSIYLSNFFTIKLREVIFILQTLMVGVYFILIYQFLKNISYNKIFIFAIFTPIFILYPIAEIEVLARKEIFIFIYFLLYTFIPIEKKTYKFLYKLFLLPVAVLIWEPVVFFILFFLFLDLIENEIKKIDRLLFLQITSYLPSILLALYIALNPISDESHKLMENSLMENFNESCYMSCALLKTKSSIFQQFQGNFDKYSIEIFVRYILIIIIGFGPLFILLFNSSLKSKVFFLNKFKNLFFPYLILLSPIILLFAMGYDWGRWVNISYVFSIISFIYIYKYNLITVSENFLKKKLFVNIKGKIFIFIIIFYCFGWNPKTAITGDVASFPGYRIPYKALKIILND